MPSNAPIIQRQGSRVAKEELERTVAVFDCETEPFDGKREHYRPFAIGFYDGKDYRRFWGYHAPNDFIKFLHGYSKPLVLYAHNGGKFDFLFFMKWLSSQILIINGRITQCHIAHHQLRDSYSIIPEPLKDFRGKNQKADIDYQHMTEENRERYKSEILDYLKDDVLTLFEGVQYFRQDFGDALTIGSAALKEFRKIYEFDRIGAADDTLFRHFYFGGRCQCFKVGVFKSPMRPFMVYDVNSMYAAVMKNFVHPISSAYEVKKGFTRKTTFACIEAENDGALPSRVIDRGIPSLDFTCMYGKFFAGIHEIEAALELGILRIKKVHYTIEHKKTSSFGEFVDWITEKKIAMEKLGEKARRNNYKRGGNSCYGKFAQDPNNYRDNIILPVKDIPPEPWTPSYIGDEYAIYEKPTSRRYFNNVAIGASITSAARSILLRGLASSSSPMYCDTDSVICKDFRGEIDPLKLGAWKFESQGEILAIASKKTYVLKSHGEVVKQASKGVPTKHEKLSEIITAMARDKNASFEIPNKIPNFKLDGSVHYITRKIRATGKAATFQQTPSLERLNQHMQHCGTQETQKKP